MFAAKLTAMMSHGRPVWTGVVLAAGLAALLGCTPSAPPPARTGDAEPTATPPEADAPAPTIAATPPASLESPADASSDERAPRPPPPGRPARGRKHCLLEGPGDDPTEALAAALVYLWVDDAFTCPAKFRLVQRRPWIDDFEFGRKAARARELFTFAGVDEATGDVLWVTLGRSDTHGFHGSSCGVPEDFRRGWACVAASSRIHGEAEPLRAWLAARAEVVHALDWLALALPVFDVDKVRWPGHPRVLHVHEGRDVTLCWQRGGSTRCWRLADVDRSELEDHGYAEALELVTTTAGVQRRWQITAGGELRGDGLAVWTKIDLPVLDLAAAYPARAIRTIRAGAVALGSYEEIGHGGVDVALVAGWALLRGDTGWSATPLPDAVVSDVLVAGGSLAITAVNSAIGDGPRFDRQELLTFAAGPRGREFAGQFERPIGEDVRSEAAERSWRYVITTPGPDCLRLAPGEVSGSVAVYNEADDAFIARPLRARDVFGKLDGDWSITPNGPRRGCPPTP